jgi:hypothetical protein
MSDADEDQPTIQKILEAWQQWRTDIERRFAQLDKVQAMVTDIHAMLASAYAKDDAAKRGFAQLVAANVANNVTKLFEEQIADLRKTDIELSERITKIDREIHTNGSDPSGASHTE